MFSAIHILHVFWPLRATVLLRHLHVYTSVFQPGHNEMQPHSAWESINPHWVGWDHERLIPISWPWKTMIGLFTPTNPTQNQIEFNIFHPKKLEMKTRHNRSWGRKEGNSGGGRERKEEEEKQLMPWRSNASPRYSWRLQLLHLSLRLPRSSKQTTSEPSWPSHTLRRIYTAVRASERQHGCWEFNSASLNTTHFLVISGLCAERLGDVGMRTLVGFKRFNCSNERVLESFCFQESTPDVMRRWGNYTQGSCGVISAARSWLKPETLKKNTVELCFSSLLIDSWSFRSTRQPQCQFISCRQISQVYFFIITTLLWSQTDEFKNCSWKLVSNCESKLEISHLVSFIGDFKYLASLTLVI